MTALDPVLSDPALPDFVLPEGLEATEPPPTRDGVRLLVARPGEIAHTRFSRLGEFLAPGDLVVVNTSATLAAAVDGNRAGAPVEVAARPLSTSRSCRRRSTTHTSMWPHPEARRRPLL